MQGGTQLTITGRFFGTIKENVKVKVAGVACDVTKVSAEEVVCTPGQADERFLQGEYFPGMNVLLIGGC